MRLFAFSLPLLLALTSFAAPFHKPFGQLQEEQKYKDYTVRVYRNEQAPPYTDTDIACFEILKSGKQVHFQSGHEFEIGNSGDGDITNKLITIGRSITSDRQPNLVIKEFTGGLHCCYYFHIFQIGDTFKLIESVELMDGIESDFKDLRRDGNLELVMWDWAFRYWNATFFDSSAPKVILRYQTGKYRPDLELMKKPAPTERELKKWAKELKPLFASKEMRDDVINELKVPFQLVRKMLDLIYSGNMKSAWELCDLSWPANHPGKSVFLKEFIKQCRLVFITTT